MAEEKIKEQKVAVAKNQKGKRYIMTIGRRKKSVARVYLHEGTGKIRVNKRTFENYFPRESHRLVIKQPIKTVGLENKLEIFAIVAGGGVTAAGLTGGA